MAGSQWKKLIFSTGVFLLVSCLGGCATLMYYINARDRDYWPDWRTKVLITNKKRYIDKRLPLTVENPPVNERPVFRKAHKWAWD